MQNIKHETIFDYLINILKSENFSFYLFLFSSSIFFIFNIIAINEPLFGFHSFRQSQTAITSFYLIQNGFSFNYETPVVGYPWSIPFEFPIYQWIVANLSSLSGFNLTSTGRFVSLIFGYLCIVPIYKSLLILGILRKYIYLIISLFLTTPLYLYWSGTFMIESTALFFSLYFLYYSIRIFKGDHKFITFLIGAILLTLALLQKATTALPILVIVCLFYLFNFNLNIFRKNSKVYFLFFLFFICPVLILYCWVNFTDSVKELNPIGLSLTSKALQSWNWGSSDHRFSNELWSDAVYDRNIIYNSIGIYGLIMISFGFFFSKCHIKKIIFSSSLLFIIPFLFFPVLHKVHNYYQYSNLVFYIILLSISIIYFIEFVLHKINQKFLNLNIIHSFIFIILIGISLSKFYFGSYGKDKFHSLDITKNRTYLISQFVKDSTPKNSSVIVYGYDWSGEIAYYSERKALTLPWERWDSEAITNTDKFLPNIKIGAIVNCYGRNSKKSKNLKKLINENYNVDTYIISECTVFINK